jgi:ADP-ribosylglycohydrolase
MLAFLFLIRRVSRGRLAIPKQAVNHGGDSDSTGSMVGNLLRRVYGSKRIPARWLEPLELREVITRVAGDSLSAAKPE